MVRRLVADNYDFIWRLLCRMNVPRDEVDDAAQQVFMVLVSKKDLRLIPGRERSYLFGVAVRTAHEFRRRALLQRSRGPLAADEVRDPSTGTEDLAGQLQARRLLDQILTALPEPARIVFILFELEGLSAREIAELTDTAPGTVASRLRRARELFQEQVKRIREPSGKDAAP